MSDPYGQTKPPKAPALPPPRPRQNSAPRGLDNPEMVREAQRTEQERVKRLVAQQELVEAQSELEAVRRQLALQQIKVEKSDPGTDSVPASRGALSLQLRVGSVNWAGLRKALAAGAKVLVALGVVLSTGLGILNYFQKGEKAKVEAANANANALQVQVNGTTDAGADAGVEAGSEVPGLAAQVAAGLAHDRVEDAARCPRDRYLQQLMAQQKPPIIFVVTGCPDAYDAVEVGKPVLDPARGVVVRHVNKPLPP